MGLRSAAKYEFGLPFARFMALNGDLTIPTPSRTIGGTGPFDFSGASVPTAVPLMIKNDADAVVSLTVDISAADDTSAVTVAELVTALTTAIGVEEYTASSANGKNGSARIQLVSSSDPLPDIMQVYGEFAELAEFGQGFGNQFVKFDTLQTFGLTPVMKDDETITITDSAGKDTEVITDGYRKGNTGTIVDTAKDPRMKVLMMGGSYNSTTGRSEAGTSESTRYYFYCEFFYPYYSEGTNQEGDIVGYKQKVIRIAKGGLGEDTHERGWSNGNYTITGTTYKDESGNLLGDEYEDELTVAEYNALDLLNV